MSATHYLITIKHAIAPAHKVCDDIIEEIENKDKNLLKANQIDKLKEQILKLVVDKVKLNSPPGRIFCHWVILDQDKEHYMLSLSYKGLNFVEVDLLGCKEVEL